MVFVMLYLGLLWSCCCYTAATTDQAQSCMDGGVLSEEVVVMEQDSPYRLSCVPADTATQVQSHVGHLTWTRGCRQLPVREGPAAGTSSSSSSSGGPVQVLDPQGGNVVLEFPSLGLGDAGNFTCMVNQSAWITFRLVVRESQCSKAPISWSPAESGGPVTVWARLGGADPPPTLRCDALLPWDPQGPPCDDLTFAWLKDGRPLANDTMHRRNSSSRSPGPGRLQVSSSLTLSLTENTDFGLYSCKLRNLSIDYTLQSNGQLSHTAAVIAALVLTVCLLVSAVLYSWCHLDVKLWYRNAYGEHQVNDGKLYDAYISYVNNEYDRKFVHFIFKPHLENKLGHRVHLNDNDILPGADPSAELLMNISRCRRLVVVLSHAYLQQDWCQTDFRQGVLHMLELVQKPVFILLDGQVKHMRSEVKVTLKELQHRLTFLTWRHNSVTPASVFWKELALSMPRGRVAQQRRGGGGGGGGGGDPQTLLHDDKDPILTLEPPDYLDCRADTHPSGDLGLRLPVYKAMTSVSSRAPVLPAAPLPVAAATSEPRPYEVDVSDLGSRSYAARTDFYCLVSDKDM